MVIIVGAGPSGIATSACLNKLSIPNIVLEREDSFASLWKYRTYDRLHLHLAKQFSQLPYMPYPTHYPKFISKNQFLEFLDTYVSHFNVKPLYNRLVELAEFDEDAGKWRVQVRNTTSNEVEEYFDTFLVVASGGTSEIYTPHINGIETFRGETSHSTEYKNGQKFSNRSALVVGCGSSGFEIALDLSNFGAKTSIVIRSPVHILNRGIVYFAMRCMKYLPVNILDWLLVIIGKLWYGDTTKYGIATPKEGPLYRLLAYGKPAVLDVGTFNKVKSGEIQVLPSITSIKGDTVEFANGKSYPFDVIVFATGFARSTNKWLKDEFLLNEDGIPKSRFPNNWKGQNGLYCAGLSRRGFHGSAYDAMNIANDISKLVRNL